MPAAIVADHPGGPEVLQLREVDELVPAENELLVRVEATGVNFIEIYQRSGVYPVEFPFTPGSEMAGVIVAMGDAVEGFSVGQRVASPSARATYAELAVVEADKAVAIPDGLSSEDAAALALQGMTAHYLCNSTFPVHAGQTALVHAGAGGVGLLLTQLLKAKGATVYTTVSTPEKAETSRQAGADAVLDYENFPAQVRALTDGDGVDVVFDGVGKATFEGSLDSLRPRGMMVLFGGASGQVPPFDLQELNSRGSLFITRPSLANYLRTPEELAWRANDIFGAAAEGTLKVDIGGRYPLKDAAQAQADLAARKTSGKLLLLPGATDMA